MADETPDQKKPESNAAALAALKALDTGDANVALVHANLAVAGEIRETREQDTQAIVDAALEEATKPLSEELEAARRDRRAAADSALKHRARIQGLLEAMNKARHTLESPTRLVGENPEERTDTLENLMRSARAALREAIEAAGIT